MKNFYLLFISFAILTGCINNEASLYKLTTESIPREGGTVAPETGDFSRGERIQLTAVPTKGWTFQYWEGAANGKSNPVEVVVEGEVFVRAVFERVP